MFIVVKAQSKSERRRLHKKEKFRQILRDVETSCKRKRTIEGSERTKNENFKNLFVGTKLKTVNKQELLLRV